jgi:hypothetical protein
MSGSVLAGMGLHVPFAAARSHRSHVPAQALLQQTLSAQWPEPHWLSIVHALPSGGPASVLDPELATPVEPPDVDVPLVEPEAPAPLLPPLPLEAILASCCGGACRPMIELQPTDDAPAKKRPRSSRADNRITVPPSG